MPAVVALLCGLPGAGKSTLCRRLADEMENAGWKAHHIEFDEVQSKVDLEDGIQRWHATRERALAQVRELLEQLNNLDDDTTKHLLLVDDNMYYASMRRPFRNAAKCARAGFTQIIVHCSLELALFRNSQREGEARVPDSVIKRMHQALELPKPGVHTIELVSLASGGINKVINASRVASNLELGTEDAAEYTRQVLEEVMECRLTQFPVSNGTELDQNREADAQATAESERHQLDLAVRRAIHTFMENVPPENKRHAARFAANTKTNFLDAKKNIALSIEDFEDQLIRYNSER